MNLNYDNQYRAVDSFRLEAVDGRDDDSVRFEWDEETLVTIDNQPWEDAFGTDQFHKAEYVVTRPAEQPYIIDGERYTFTKPRTDLKRASWRLDNLPWTIEHPQSKRVVDVDEARGFWRGPFYDESRDEQRVDLYIPSTDDEALEYASEHEGVSVGFTHDLTAVDEYEGKIGGDVDTAEVDALQTNIYYDHVATTKNPRLPSSGLVASDAMNVDVEGETPTIDADCGGLATTIDSINDEQDSTPDTDSEVTDSDSNNNSDSDTTMDDLEIDNLTVDTIAEQNDEVAELVEENDSLESEVDELEEQKSAVKSELDSVKDELESYKDIEREQKIDSLTDLTDHWDEEELEDVDLDTLDDRIELAKELTDGNEPTAPQTDNGDGEGGDDPTPTKVVDLSHTA